MLYKTKSTEANVFKPKDVRKLFSTIAGAAKERQRDDPLWVPTEEIKDMLSRHKRGEKFTVKERQKFADTLKAMGVPDAKGFVAIPPDQQQSILEDKRKRAARSSSFIEAHEGSWLDQVLERISGDEQKAQRQKERAESMMRGGVVGAPSQKWQAAPVAQQQLNVAEQVPAFTPNVVTPKPQPSSQQKSLFTQRRQGDSTHDLYSAVHAAYYHRTAFASSSPRERKRHDSHRQPRPV
jgi:hypothetical protein